MKEYVIAIDISLSSTGVAIFNLDGSIKKLITIETNSKDETQIRLKKIADEMFNIKKKYKPKIVIMERGFYRYNTSTEQVFRAHGIMNYVFWDIEQVYYHSTTIRKIVAGKGNLKKEQVRDYILSKYNNVTFLNYDESDSFAVGLTWFINNGILKG